MKLNVKVIPNAKKERIEEDKDGLKVHITSAAIEGKANKKLIEVLAEFFNVKKYNIRIIKGQNQRQKVIRIEK